MIAIQVFTASGIYVPTASMTTCVIECVGGGSGGNGKDGQATTNAVSGGGGSGAYAKKLATAVQIGALQAVTIGIGGTGGPGTSSSSGGAGGDTSVGALCVAKGAPANGVTYAPCSGGPLAGCVGDYATAGAAGRYGCLFPAAVGGGGGTGGGGNSMFGAGAVDLPWNATATGNAARGYGGGGGGGAIIAAGSVVGGVGGAGLVVITEYGMTALASTAGQGNVRYDLPQGLTTTQKNQARANIATPLRGQLAGLMLSTAGSSATFSVAAGEAADSTVSDLMQLTSAISKTTAAWAVGSGNGTLDTGTIAINTWYHVYLIKRPDTGVVDVLISLSATAPTLPASYTLFRRIGSMQTNASSQWLKFAQVGDRFIWDFPVVNANAVGLGNVSSAFAMTVPPGVSVEVNFHGYWNANTAGTYVVFSSPLAAALTSANNPAGSVSLAAPVAGTVAGQFSVQTDLGQVIKAFAGAGGGTLYLNTLGWVDRRGRDV